MKLTKSAIDKAVFQGTSNRAAYILWDNEIPGFGIRIYPSGKKSFVISYRFNGRSRQQTIGAYGVFTLDQAKKEARRQLVSVESGIDPAHEKEKQKSGDTIEDLCKTYLERHSKIHNKPKSWKEDERRIQSRIIPAFGKMKILALKRSDVSVFHEKLGVDYPYEANRVRALLSSMFERAREWILIPENHPNPAKSVKRFKEHKRDRWVTPEEMPKLTKSIDAEQNVYVRAALCLYLLTGMRKNELLSVKWEDIDLNQGQIRLSDTKAGRIHYVELSQAAISILKQIPRSEGNPYLIVGKKKGACLVNIDIPWQRVRRNAGIDDVRLHDLRRTFGSWLATQGTPLLHIGKLLNHSNSSTTEIYARLSQNPLRQAVEELGDKMLNNKEETADEQ